MPGIIEEGLISGILGEKADLLVVPLPVSPCLTVPGTLTVILLELGHHEPLPGQSLVCSRGYDAKYNLDEG